jgi:thioredoxin-dependent peroxiredoxin
MKKLIPVSIASMLMALPVFAALEVGDSAPMFEARASLDGQEFDYSLSAALEDGPVVVYFYPSAYTMGCNMQAREFSELKDSFAAAGATVVGVSLDSIERLNDFSADPEWCAGNLAVASDTDGSIARSFELSVSEGRAGMLDSRGEEIDHGFASRTTFIVTPDGKIAETIDTVPPMSPVENVHLSLAAVEKLAN